MSQDKQLRTDREGLQLLIDDAKNAIASPETTLAFRALQMARGWTGKVLASKGNKSPYKVADVPSEIPPTADVADTKEESPQPEKTHLGKINLLRSGIKEAIAKLNAYPAYYKNHEFQNAVDNLEVASMWYGYELQRIRDEARKQELAKEKTENDLAFQDLVTGGSDNFPEVEN